MRKWLNWAGLLMVGIALVGCSGTNYTVRAGFVHDYLSTDPKGDIAGWGAGEPSVWLPTMSLQAVELCGRGSWSFGKAETKGGTNRDIVNSTPIEVCAEFPVGF